MRPINLPFGFPGSDDSLTGVKQFEIDQLDDGYQVTHNFASFTLGGQAIPKGRHTTVQETELAVLDSVIGEYTSSAGLYGVPGVWAENLTKLTKGLATANPKVKQELLERSDAALVQLSDPNIYPIDVADIRNFTKERTSLHRWAIDAVER